MVSKPRPPLGLAVTSLGLLIATALSSSENKSLELYTLLAATLIFSATAAALEWRARTLFSDDGDVLAAVVDGLKVPRACRWLVIAPSMLLTILLLARLLCVEHFSTDPAALDFGPKHCDGEPNASFAGGFSFGHWIQGFAAALLAYPAVRGVLARLGRGTPLVLAAPRAWCLLSADVASFAFTLYPSYNFVKRMATTPDTFATSSYMNNGCEWATGALVGMSLGMLSSSLTAEHLVLALRKAGLADASGADGGSRHMEPYSFATPEEPPGGVPRLCRGAARMLGVLFLMSVVGAAAMTGITWNNCEDEIQ